MTKESLEKIQDKVFEIVDSSDIEIIDKVELLINIVNFLDPDKYEDNIQVLREHELKLRKQPR